MYLKHYSEEESKGFPRQKGLGYKRLRTTALIQSSYYFIKETEAHKGDFTQGHTAGYWQSQEYPQVCWLPTYFLFVIHLHLWTL